MNKEQEAAIKALRILSIEGVQAANSGHPGLPLGAAPIGYTLFANHLVHNPRNPKFFNRDRFVLSAGHGSMLLYALLHVFGYDITKNDLKNFRQFGSVTTGHPECHLTPGVDVSTGPLGQGIANAVGFALAERIMAERFNKEDETLVDHYTYALCGDGCLQEGVALEAASLAGTLALHKLIVLYDCNRITIEGSIDLAFTEDVGARHAAQGWQVLHVYDGENVDEIDAAILLAKADKSRPSIIIVHTTIGYGSPRAGLASSHGSPLGIEGVKATRKFYKYTAKGFELSKQAELHYDVLKLNAVKHEQEWNRQVKAYRTKYPEEYDVFEQWTKGMQLTEEQSASLYVTGEEPQAIRKSSHMILNKLSDMLPNLWGGSADLGPSNLTVLDGKGDLSKDNYLGRNIHFGIREHAMAAIANGMKLHGGLEVFCATFFAFSDYMKNAIRMSAIMELPVIYVFTHDSIGVGEDGPTHQPVEHLAGLRAMPGLDVFRPCDHRETAAAYISALRRKCPTAIVASRQDLPQIDGTGENALLGGYILSDSEKKVPDIILMASGSEVILALKAKQELKKAKVDARVVSMPCIELFESQKLQYRQSVFPNRVRARVAIEAASSYSWGKYVGLDGEYICMDTFGQCGKPDVLFQHYGFTVENIVTKALSLYRRTRRLAD